VISGIAAFLLVGTLAMAAGVGGGDGDRSGDNSPAFTGSIAAPRTMGSASAQARAVQQAARISAATANRSALQARAVQQAARISAATANRSALRAAPGTVTATALTVERG